MEYHIVDVFGTGTFSGNQLAVVICPESLSKEKMQRIANEFHFSETSFVTLSASRNGEWRTSIFTPLEEVPFAGHPSLGTAWVIRKHLIKDETQKLETVILDLPVGKIPVKAIGDLLWMQQIQPEFGPVHNPEDIAPIVNLEVGDLDTSLPIQEVSTGIPFTIIPLRSLQALKRAATNLPLYRSYFRDRTATPLFLFCPETREPGHDFACRMFADEFGITEDPATGSANGCLAGYLLQHTGVAQIKATVEQGYELGRNSLLYLDAFADESGLNINVGGRVFPFARGLLL